MNKNITSQVNRIYKQKNPSTYFRNPNVINKFLKNREDFLFNLRLPKRIFANSSMIDFGCGTGQNSLIYNYLGSGCTLIEYDKKSVYSYTPKNIRKIEKKFTENSINMNIKDIVVFSENVLHRSNKNLTNKIRFAGTIRHQIIN